MKTRDDLMVGTDYSVAFNISAKATMIYNGGDSWTGTQVKKDGTVASRTIESVDTTEKVLAYISGPNAAVLPW